MRSGRMDRRINIQQATDTADAHGQPVADWVTYKTVWAEIIWKKGREYFTAAQELAEAEAVFRIRWISGVTRKMRINYDSNNYDILSITEIGRREGLEIIARANVS